MTKTFETMRRVLVIRPLIYLRSLTAFVLRLRNFSKNLDLNAARFMSEKGDGNEHGTNSEVPRICGDPYKVMPYYAGDQSGLPDCVRKAEKDKHGKWAKSA